jgi:hypothetical protein
MNQEQILEQLFRKMRLSFGPNERLPVSWDSICSFDLVSIYVDGQLLDVAYFFTYESL